MSGTIETPDWSTIPAPVDDGAARHLAGARVPSVPLMATNGERIDLSAIRGRVIVYAFPRTGKPGIANPDRWDMIPGACSDCTVDPRLDPTGRVPDTHTGSRDRLVDRPWIGPWYVAVPDELIDLVEVNPGLIPVSEQAQLHSLGNL